ncbi:hypothetical protein DC31_11870 [Microbacterium sp. CH12i]|nr:hypothetical protein DC31_11870 [Microbacterium sp. CH12i]
MDPARVTQRHLHLRFGGDTCLQLASLREPREHRVEGQARGEIGALMCDERAKRAANRELP